MNTSENTSCYQCVSKLVWKEPNERCTWDSANSISDDLGTSILQNFFDLCTFCTITSQVSQRYVNVIVDRNIDRKWLGTLKKCHFEDWKVNTIPPRYIRRFQMWTRKKSVPKYFTPRPKNIFGCAPLRRDTCNWNRETANAVDCTFKK
jgi:hypothetical protein